MTVPSMTRFDPATLLARAGPKVFARGEGYANPGQVSLLSIAPDRIVAEVYGSETYGVRLIGLGTDLDGSCDCPAFEDAGFCKHFVAVALLANQLLEAGAETDTLISDIRTYLASFTKDRLVDYVASLAESIPSLFRRLGYDADLEPREGWD